MIHCLHCRAETSNGLALCDLCRRFAVSCLTHLPTYFRNLARWRPGRAGSRPTPGSRVLYDGDVDQGGDRVTRALDEAGNALTTWVRTLTDARPELLTTRPVEPIFGDLAGSDLTEAESIAWICHGFERHLTSISTTDWCGEFVRDLAAQEDVLRLLTEDVAPGWYAGGCRRCDAGVYVVPGLTWLTCRGCGTTTAARDHTEVVLDEAREWIATPKRLAEVIVALVETEPSVDSLRKRIAIWGERGHLPAHRVSQYAQRRYRLGDVIDQIASRAMGEVEQEAS